MSPVAVRQDPRAARPHPQLRHAAHRHGQRPGLRRHDGRARHLDPPGAGRPCRDARRGRHRQPGARRAQAPGDSPGVAAGALGELRSGPPARGGRQSAEQRHQIQPDRRQDRAVDERRQGVHRHPASRTRAPASRRRTSGACSAASSGCPPSRPAAKARPGSASRSSSASSSCTAARSPRKVPGPGRGSTFIDPAADGARTACVMTTHPAYLSSWTTKRRRARWSATI